MKKVIFTILIMVIASLSYPQNIDSGLVAYYPFNNNANDESGNGNNGILGGSYQFVPGKIGTGLKVNKGNICEDSLGGHVRLPDFHFNTLNSFSYFVWVKEDTSICDAASYLFFRDNPLGTEYAGIMHNGNVISFMVGVTSTNPPITIPFNSNYLHNFVHYGLTYENGTLKAYINGVLVGQKNQLAITSGIYSAISRAWFSTYTSTRLTAFIDDVRIYNRAITQSEVTRLFKGLNDGLIAYYPFNNNANDESGNGKNGILGGSYQFVPGKIGTGLKVNKGNICEDSLGGHVRLPNFHFNTLNSFSYFVYVKEDTSICGAASYLYFRDNPLGTEYAGIMHNDYGNTISFMVGVTSTNPPLDIPFNSNYLHNYVHYGLTYENGTLKAYINGVLVGQKNQLAITSGIYSAISRAWFSSYTSTRLTAIIDEVRIYNRALSQSEINQLIIGIKANNTEIPEKYNLSQNYPNPFNPSTNIKFDLSKNTFATLKVFDILGKEVAILVNKKLNAGTYQVDWNAAGFPSGVYFYRLQTGDYTETKRMTFIK